MMSYFGVFTRNFKRISRISLVFSFLALVGIVHLCHLSL